MVDTSDNVPTVVALSDMFKIIKNLNQRFLQKSPFLLS